MWAREKPLLMGHFILVQGLSSRNAKRSLAIEDRPRLASLRQPADTAECFNKFFDAGIDGMEHACCCLGCGAGDTRRIPVIAGSTGSLALGDRVKHLVCIIAYGRHEAVDVAEQRYDPPFRRPAVSHTTLIQRNDL